METTQDTITNWLEERVQSVQFLHDLWQKSRHPEENKTGILKAQLALTEDILDKAIPVYAQLIDKDRLSPKELWTLKFIQETFGSLLATLTHAIHFHAYERIAGKEDLPKELTEKAIRVYEFLTELVGYSTKEDKDIKAQIKRSLKDIKAGRVKPAKDVFAELGI